MHETYLRARRIKNAALSPCHIRSHARRGVRKALTSSSETFFSAIAAMGLQSVGSSFRRIKTLNAAEEIRTARWVGSAR